MRKNAMDVTYELVRFRGNPALLTEGRVDKETIPPGVYCYDIRHSDNNEGKPCTLENYVLVNFYGSVITKDPIVLPAEGYLKLKPHALDFFDAKSMSLTAFLALPKERPLNPLEQLKADKAAMRSHPKQAKKAVSKGADVER